MAELPTTFGKYFLTEKLATGGMAEIYLAKLTGPGGFEKSLVIKQILPRLSGQRQFVDLFVAEAKTLVGLAHGNIVPIYELGVIEDTYFLAMEYIDGPTLYRLTEVMARREVMMAPALAAWIIARILEGLDYAHRKGEGVIHRDLSPRNVMLSRDGEVKLVDFGIAVTLGGDDDERAPAGAPTGSFPYMSPEQVRRERLTPQSDLFSVGVLFWEMLVGERLFARSDAEETLAAVTDSRIPHPSDRRPEVPPRLEDVVMRALLRDPAERWTSAGEMLAQIQKYLYSLDETPGPRDVAALVAKFCPPETRRLPTHSEGFEPSADDPVPAAGPRTAVIPRDGEPGGKRVRARTETFATNVQLMALVTPTTRVVGDETAAIARAPARPRWLVGAALGTVAVGAVAVIMLLRDRESAADPPRDAAVPMAIDAAPSAPDAAPFAPDAAPDAPPDAPPPADAPVRDAPTPRDAPEPPPRDAGTKLKPDASEPRTGTATLRIGADPWGEIFVDGQPKGRTPAVLTVPAGKHTIEVIYGGEDPPRTETFTVDLADGQMRELQADFSGP